MPILELLDKWIYIISLIVLMIIGSFLFVNKKRFKRTPTIGRIIALTFLIHIGAYYYYEISQEAYHRLIPGDLCPYTFIFLAFALLINNERMIKMAAPWAVIGALVTMALSKPGFINETSVAGIFSYTRHMWLAIIGTYIMITSKVDKIDINLVWVLPASLFTFILMVNFPIWKATGSPKWATYTTALLEPSYSKLDIPIKGGIVQYASYEAFGDIGIPYPAPTAIFYGIWFTAAFTIQYVALKVNLRRSTDE